MGSDEQSFYAEIPLTRRWLTTMLEAAAPFRAQKKKAPQRGAFFVAFLAGRARPGSSNRAQA